MQQFSVEQFQALTEADVCRHAFIKRIPRIDVSHDKAEALRRLETAHEQVRRSLKMDDWPLVTAEQIHSNKVAIIRSAFDADKHLDGVDAVITKQHAIALGVHVADCCAVYIVDPATRAIGLIHSGHKGTELNIVGSAINQMTSEFGSTAADLIVQLSPCIRPPHYEVDFAANIIEQCRDRGVRQIYDSGICNACNLDEYYSYRAEQGKTGRMLALLALV
jgi:copper oxidase (laccase) domain-containing protein